MRAHQGSYQPAEMVQERFTGSVIMLHRSTEHQLLPVLFAVSLSTNSGVDLTQALRYESFQTHILWIFFHFVAHCASSSFLSSRCTSCIRWSKDNKKPWDCRWLPVPTAEEISSPVLLYPQQGGVPPEIGTRIPDVRLKAVNRTRMCLASQSRPVDIVQMPTAPSQGQ